MKKKDGAAEIVLNIFLIPSSTLRFNQARTIYIFQLSPSNNYVTAITIFA